MLEGMAFAVGPTTVARRRFVDEAGGIEALKDDMAKISSSAAYGR